MFPLDDFVKNNALAQMKHSAGLRSTDVLLFLCGDHVEAFGPHDAVLVAGAMDVRNTVLILRDGYLTLRVVVPMTRHDELVGDLMAAGYRVAAITDIRDAGPAPT